MRNWLRSLYRKINIDVYAHGITSVLISFFISILCIFGLDFQWELACVVAMFLTFFIGLWKEYLDEYASSDDLIADGIGAILGSALAAIVYVVSVVYV